MVNELSKYGEKTHYSRYNYSKRTTPIPELA